MTKQEDQSQRAETSESAVSALVAVPEDSGNDDNRQPTTKNKPLKRSSDIRDKSKVVFQSRDVTGKSETSLTIDFGPGKEDGTECQRGDDPHPSLHSLGSISCLQKQDASQSKQHVSFDTNCQTNAGSRRKSGMMTKLSSFTRAYVSDRDISSGKRTRYAATQKAERFKISRSPTEQKAERVEVFFTNHGMGIFLGILYLMLNLLAAATGAYQFTEVGGWTTEDDILRVTLPIARAGGRLVTINCAILLLTACKYLWTCVRTHVVPVIPIAFLTDDIMPKYHRYVALTIIFCGCVIHTLPQIVNYATASITMNHEGLRFWTFGDGFATKQLLITGTLLTIIFSTFFLTTLKCFRKTTAGFRWFWFFHMGGVATAYPLLIVHGSCRGYPLFLYVALLPLLLYLFDVLMRRKNVSTVKVIKWQAHDDDGQQITELVTECPKDFKYTPGQYAELKFLPISRSEWHPFTIASAPNYPYEEGPHHTFEVDEEQKKLVFCIKNVGRWTQALFDYASAYDLTKSINPVTIELRGPHGAPAMNYFEYQHIVVIGSGVGVTPLLSIWKYLMAKGREMSQNGYGIHSIRSSVMEKLNSSIASFQIDGFQSREFSLGLGTSFRGHNSSLATWDTEDLAEFSELRMKCLKWEKVLESMTVSLCLFILFILGETVIIVLQIFRFYMSANALGAILSLIALLVHGTIAIVSTIALGCSWYFRLFKCWLECSIILVDTIAFWLSIRGRSTSNTAYLVMFGLVVALHGIRVFHIYFMILKPHDHSTSKKEKSGNKRASKKAIMVGFDNDADNDDSGENEICSIDGILINRTYASMRFAARCLLPKIMQFGLTDVFSMEFYGTREKHENKKSERTLITQMMGSKGDGIDVEASMASKDHSPYFHPGRPDWNKIFTKALAKAHVTNPKGERVGVFFCGSPAIAKDLQLIAANVTAQHHFAVKHLEGKACKCKLIVHSENF